MLRQETNKKELTGDEELINDLRNKIREEEEMHKRCMSEFRQEMNKVINQLKNKEKKLKEEYDDYY